MYPAATVINATRYMRDRSGRHRHLRVPEDAAACVTWARETGVPFAVRSGGHSYAGFSNSDGLVIDVKGMRAVSVDPATGTVTVAGGANNADVGGSAPAVWRLLPGWPLPDGRGLRADTRWRLGIECRHLGMTCDSLVSTDVVTASGDIVTASETEHPDLFWAVRGAGGGNFGVHTSFTYNVAAARDVTVFRLSWSGGDTAALVDAHHADAGSVRASSVSAWRCARNPACRPPSRLR